MKSIPNFLSVTMIFTWLQALIRFLLTEITIKKISVAKSANYLVTNLTYFLIVVFSFDFQFFKLLSWIIIRIFYFFDFKKIGARPIFFGKSDLASAHRQQLVCLLFRFSLRRPRRCGRSQDPWPQALAGAVRRRRCASAVATISMIFIEKSFGWKNGVATPKIAFFSLL